MQFPTIYPVLHDGYAIEPGDGVEESFADDGTPRYRRLWANDWTDIRFRIGPLTPTQKLAVLQFYRSYRYQYIEWTDPFTGIVYDVIMTRFPRMSSTEVSAGRTCVLEIFMKGTERNES